MKTQLQILIIEDSPEDALLMLRELEQAGYEVARERVETADALKRALGQQTWDAVLCDYTLPQLSGKAALQAVREADADLPFIYVSGTMGEETAIAALKAGANDYVLKNNLTRLAPAVERELREARLRRKHRVLEAERDRLVTSLSAALMDVKRLSGLLPICSVCKKIRNDHNEWQQLETFIRNHSEAQFTHSLCPDCLSRLYGSAGRAGNLKHGL